MKFNQILKTLAISSILVFTLIMTVIGSAMATETVHMTRMPATATSLHPGDIDPSPFEDMTAPVTNAVYFTRWTNKPVEVALVATDSQSGVAKTMYSIEGLYLEELNDKSLDPAPIYVEGDSISVFEAGITTISFYSIDKAGNVEKPKEISVKIDYKAPITKTNAPRETQTKVFSFDLEIFDDISGVKDTFYSFDGKSFTEGNLVTVNTEGTKTISYYSVDYAGNVEDTHTVTVSLDFPAEEDDDNDGGSSGGSSSSARTYTLTAAQLSQGFSVYLRENDRIKFTLNGQAHILTLADILSSSVKMNLDNKVLTYGQKTSQVMDLNRNNLNDFELIVGSLTSNTALVIVQSMTEIQPIVIVDEDEESTSVVEPETPIAEQPVVEETFVNENEQSADSIYNIITGMVTGMSNGVKVGLGSALVLIAGLVALIIAFRK